MLRRLPHILLVLIAAWSATNCSAPPRDSGDSVETESRADAAGVAETPLAEPNLELPPPASVADHVRPLTGEALDRAGVSLDDLLASLPVPAALVPGDPPAAGGETNRAAAKAYLAGRMAYLSGDLPGAIARLERARGLTPRDPAVLRLLGIVHFARRTDAQGVKHLTESLKLRPDDSEALFLLGSAARRKQSWDEAIVYFVRSSRAGDGAVIPAVRYLRPYYLGQVLLQRGYLAAAVGQLDGFLHETLPIGSVPRLYPEVALLTRQSGRVLQEVGDLLCRLGRPDDAIPYYLAAQGDEFVEADGLAARLIYTELAHGLFQTAEQSLADRLEASASPASLALVPYIAQHTDDRDRFTRLLRSSYERTERTGSLALAVAEFLPPGEAIAFLSEHLGHRPTDPLVLARLIARLSGEDGAALAPAVVGLIEKHPAHARHFAAEVVRGVEDPAVLLASLDTLPPATHDSAAALYLRGVAYDQAERMQDAGRAYDRAIAADPAFLAPRLSNAQLQVRQRRPDRALELLDQLPTDRVDPEARLMRIRILGVTGRHDEAIRSLEELSAAAPDNHDYLLELGRWQHAAKRFNDAEQTFERVLRVDRTNESAFGLLFMLIDDPDNPSADGRRFVDLLRRAREQLPSGSVTRFWMALYEYRSQRPDRAEAILKELLAEQPGHTGALRALSQIYENQDRGAEAFDLLLAEARRRPRDSTPLQLIDEALARDAQRGAAERKFEALVEAVRSALNDPPATLVRVNFLSRFHLRREEYDEAAGALEKAATEMPVHAATLHYERAKVRQVQGDEAAAEAALLDVLAVEPGHPGANNDLAYSWIVQERDLDKALEMVKLAVAAVPNEGAYLDSLGWAYYKRGDFTAAAEQLRKAQESDDGSDPVILDHLGDALWRLGEKEEARRRWDEARQKLGPFRPESATSKERMQVKLSLEAKLDAVRKNTEPPVAPAANAPPLTPNP